MHFGISEGKGGGVKTWKPSVAGYGYFRELPIPHSLLNLLILIQKGSRFPHPRKTSGRYWDGRGGKNYGNRQTGGFRSNDILLWLEN